MGNLDALLYRLRNVLQGGQAVANVPQPTPTNTSPTPPNTINFVNATVAYNPSLNSYDVTTTATAAGGQQTTTVGNGLNSNIATGSQATIRLSGPTAAFSVGGFTIPAGATPQAGTILDVVNTTSKYMTIVHEDTSSTSIYRIDTGSGIPVPVPPRKGAVRFVYDGTTSRWVLQNAGYQYPRVFDPRDFGAGCNARFYNATNHQWYQDSGLTVPATDDSAALAACFTLASANTPCAVYIPAGVYLTAKQGSNGEFIRLTTGNITIYGDGFSSSIHVGPGFNTGVSPVGYTCILGNFDGVSSGTAVDLSGLRVTGIQFDHNSQGNQWNSSNFSGQTAAVALNAAVCVVKGSNIQVDHCTFASFNGIDNVVIGTFGGNQTNGTYLVTGFNMSDNTFSDTGADPNQGDSNGFACGGYDGTVHRNRFLNSAFRPSTTAMETHGVGISVIGNTINDMHRMLNVAGDSLDAYNILVAKNVARNVDTGVTLYSYQGRKIVNCKITGNLFGLIKSTNFFAPGVYAGVQTSYGDGSTIGYGSGFFDLVVEGNTVVWLDTVNAVPTNTYGVYFIGNTGGGSSNQQAWQATHAYTTVNLVQAGGSIYECTVAGTSGGSSPFSGSPTTYGTIVTGDGGVTWMSLGSTSAAGGLDIKGNMIDGMGASGIQIIIGQAANTGNRLYDVHIDYNTIRNSGTYGVGISGGSGDTTVQFKTLEVRHNHIIDDRGSPTLSIGVVCTAFTDNSCIIWDNIVFGFTNTTEFFDPTNYPTQSQFYPQRTFNTVTCLAPNLTTGTQEVVSLQNLTAATAGVTVQDSPAYGWQGKYWTGSASALVDARAWVTPGAHPKWVFDSFINGASYAIVATLSLDQLLLAAPAVSVQDSSAVTGQINTASGGKYLALNINGVGAVTNATATVFVDSTGNVVSLNTPSSGGSSGLYVNGNSRVLAKQSEVDLQAPLVLTSQNTATSATAGTNGDVPAQVLGYLTVTINGTTAKIPYYNN